MVYGLVLLRGNLLSDDVGAFVVGAFGRERSASNDADACMVGAFGRRRSAPEDAGACVIGPLGESVLYPTMLVIAVEFE